MVGFAASEFTWESMITSTILPNSEFDCIIESSTQKLYFSIANGVVREIRPSNIASSEAIPDLKKTFTLGAALRGQSHYTITYYPVVKGPSPYLAVIVFVSCVGMAALITGIFATFNHLVTQVVDETKGLLNSKRVFVRFVSHEIR